MKRRCTSGGSNDARYPFEVSRANRVLGGATPRASPSPRQRISVLRPQDAHLSCERVPSLVQT